MKIKYFVMMGFVILSLGFISSAVGPLCNSSVIEENSIFIVQGEIINSTILEIWNQTLGESYTEFGSVEVEINVTKSIKGDKNIGNVVSVGYQTILGGHIEGGIYYPIFELGEIVEYRNVSEVIEFNDTACEIEKILKVEVETLTQITSLTPTITISAYPTEFEVAVNSSKDITKYKWEFGNGDSETTETNQVVYTYNSTGLYILKITATDLNQNEFSKSFNVTVSSPKQAINDTLKNKLDDLNNVKTQIKTFDLFYQTSLNSVLNINSLNSTLYEIQKDYTNASSETEYNKIFIELLETNIPKQITTSKTADSISFYSGEENIDLEILTLITEEGYDFEDEDKYFNSILAWNHENIEMKINFKEISVTYKDLTKPALNVFEIEVIKKSDSENFYFILYELEGLKFKEDLFNERQGYFYSEMSESNTIIFSTTEEIGFADLPIFISPEISKLSIAGYDPNIRDDPEEKKWGLFILTMSLLIIIGFITYIILQEWYKRKYENYLFKNRNNLYNLFTYIENVKRKGSNNKEVVSKLKKAGWNSEQIKYVTKKHAGKRTGMLELPVEKILNLFKKANNKKVR